MYSQTYLHRWAYMYRIQVQLAVTSEEFINHDEKTGTTATGLQQNLTSIS
jgi:hypothetical protein